ncbi:aldo/keto reductase [Clostridium sp. PL3]|uniref:Aldo/keto reductase n=1 Tax=Clostridium thailandense TaxID=2794346 RepID=A0A949TU58_9CLOT|nr:aldo/keto reductase [Clostridium thailandense]MBV7271435.1 aldo/keto reductase [Clostridium thailandense]
MLYKNINNSELKVSSICLGSAFMGSSTIPKKESHGLLDLFEAEGGNFIDTAHIYSDWLPGEKSISEKTIGEWLKIKKNRHNMIIGTKGAHPDFGAMNVSRLSKKEVLSDLEGSLQALKTDYIDIYWLHRDDENRPVEEIIDYLNEFVKSGKILNFGCSNWKAYRMKEALDYAAKKKINGFVANQNMWSYAELNVENLEDKTLVVMDKEAREIHNTYSLAAIPYSSQANGFFTKLSQNRLSDAVKKLYFNNENLDGYERVKKVAKEKGMTISDVVLTYLTSQPFVTVPVVGCRNEEQLKDSLKASDLKFNREILEYLEYRENK